MRKLIVACPCGQRMQVARSAYGKIGVCPKCGLRIRVGANGLEPLALPSPDDPLPRTPPQASPLHQDHPHFHDRRPEADASAIESEYAKRKFGESVDLFYRAHYAEALAILDGLLRDYPGNPQIEDARVRCMTALRASTAAGPQNEPPAPAESTQSKADRDSSRSTPTVPPEDSFPDAELTPEAVRRTVLALMQRGSTDTVRLQAAELACRILGLGSEQHVHPEPKGSVLFMNMKRGNGNGRQYGESVIHDESAAALAAE